MKNTQIFTGYLSIFLCAVLWSTSGLFIKLIDWHPAVIAGCRSFLAIFVLLAVRFRQEKPKKIIPLFAAGIWYAMAMVLFIFANKMTFSANAIILQYAAPVWACFLGWIFLKEKPHWDHWLALSFVCLGLLIIFGNQLAGGSVLGDIFALVSGIALAANYVALRGFKNGNSMDVMICAHLMCFLFSVPFLFINPPKITQNSILAILFLGFIQLGAASALLVYGTKRVKTVQGMLITTIEPVLNPVWVLLFIGEIPHFSVIAGGAVIITAAVISSVIGIQREKRLLPIRQAPPINE